MVGFGLLIYLEPGVTNVWRMQMLDLVRAAVSWPLKGSAIPSAMLVHGGLQKHIHCYPHGTNKCNVFGNQHIHCGLLK